MEIAFPPSKHAIVTEYAGVLSAVKSVTGKDKNHIVNWVHSRMQPTYPTNADMVNDLNRVFDAYMEKFGS